MKLSKKQLLDELEVEVRNQISIVTKHYLHADHELINKPTLDGRWSIAQCLDHLNSYGDYYLPKINEALKNASVQPDEIFVSGWLGDYFVKSMSPETGTKKHGALKKHMPALNLDSAIVISEFLRQQRLLLNYLLESESRDLSVRIPTSISKWITLKLGDILRFVIGHNRRHIVQAERNYNKVK